MNVLFLTLSEFDSFEQSGIYTDLMRQFIRSGHPVHAISPSSSEKTHVHSEGANKILKINLTSPVKKNILVKGFLTISMGYRYYCSAKKCFKDTKFDLIIYATPPITLNRTISYFKNRDNAKTYLLLKDIFPQNAVDLGYLHPKGLRGFLYKYFRSLEKRLYCLSDVIGCMSPANKSFILKNNPDVSEDKVQICPNTIDKIEETSLALDERCEVFKSYGIPSNKTICIYGGNLGAPQDVDFIIDCINSNSKSEEFHFVIAGSGTKASKIETYANNNSHIVTFLGQVEKSKFEHLVRHCDVGLIFLSPRFTIPNFPSRLLSYLNARLPILCATDSSTDIGEIASKAEFGFYCTDHNLNEFNKYLQQLSKKDVRTKLGENGRTFFEQNYTSNHAYQIIMSNFNN